MRYIYTIDGLNAFLKKGNIVLYGAGDRAKRLVDHAIAVGLQQDIAAMAVSSMDGEDGRYKGIRVCRADSLLQDDRYHVMIAVSWKYQEEIAQAVERYRKDYVILAQDLHLGTGDTVDHRKKVPYKGIDLLLPGFTKCGTSSLHKALATVDDIYLARQKESHFFAWCDKVEDPKRVLIENYFDDIREGQIVGMIEPTFAAHAKEIRDLFGPDIRLIFLVRDPVGATFSRFKMMLRGNAAGESLYQKYGRYSPEMFDEYIGWDQGKGYGVIMSGYIEWIDTFRQYYPEDQIDLVCFEDLVHEPKKVIDEILRSVGSRCRYPDEKLPLVNEGNYVMAGLEDFRTARQYNILSWEYRTCFEGDPEKKDRCYAELMQAKRALEKAEKLYDVRVSKDQRKRLERYYEDSVRKLERSFHKDLSDLWF